MCSVQCITFVTPLRPSSRCLSETGIERSFPWGYDPAQPASAERVGDFLIGLRSDWKARQKEQLVALLKHHRKAHAFDMAELTGYIGSEEDFECPLSSEEAVSVSL